jgi:hypothetical protein
MTEDEVLFASLDHYDNPTETIIYGHNDQRDVGGLGKIAISTTNSIEDVYHVQGLGYNLLSVSQLCEKGYNCPFTHEGVTVSRKEDSSIVFVDHLWGKLYYVDFTKVDCRMDLPGPTTSVGTRTDNSVGPWDYPTCVARYLMA